MEPVVSIIVPVYNEEATLAEVVDRIYADKLAGLRKEVIVCNDGSTDGTASAIATLQQRYPGLRGYSSPINLGKGAAVRVGLSLARGDVLLIQDADLELDPRDYPEILAPFSKPEVKVVYGSRFLSSVVGLSPSARWANRFLTWLTNFLFGGTLTDMETAYKAFRREVLGDLKLRCVGFDIEPEVTAQLLRAGYHILEVPVTYHPRTVAEGKKMRWRDGADAVYTLLRCRFLA